MKAIASRSMTDAQKRRDEFFPDADVYDDYRVLLERQDITVIDATPHLPIDFPLSVMQLLQENTLSPKPFVLDLAEGKQLVELAKKQDVCLASTRTVVGLPISAISAMPSTPASLMMSRRLTFHCNGTDMDRWHAAFENIHHLILFDFGIHWFDIANCMMAITAESVFAETRRFDRQVFQPPAIASAIIRYPLKDPNVLSTQLGEEDVTTVSVPKARCVHAVQASDQSEMQIFLKAGQCSVPLTGCWFESGFDGAMGELLCAIEEKREPSHSAANNLQSLELCFAAIQSADTGQPVEVGTVQTVSH